MFAFVLLFWFGLLFFPLCSAILGRAEKKILNAAGKLATMAKGLETPLRHLPQNKSTRSGMLVSVVVLISYSNTTNAHSYENGDEK